MYCFYNSNDVQPECEKVEGMIKAYKGVMEANYIRPSGPTYFAPIIERVTKLASAVKSGDNYFICLILTDGVIADMKATAEAIKKAQQYPMSIIIVGIGSADFRNMNRLDSDVDQDLKFERDIVEVFFFYKLKK